MKKSIVPLSKEQQDLVKQWMALAFKIARSFKRRYRVPCDVEDIVGYAYVGLCEAARDHDPSKSKFSTFANMKMTYAILNSRAPARGFARNTARNNEPVFYVELADVFIDTRPNIEQQLIDASDVHVVRRAVKGSTLFKQRYVDGMTLREIASVLGMSHTTINKRDKKLRDSVRRALEREAA